MSIKNRFVSMALLGVVVLIGWFGLAFRPAQSRLGELHANVDSTRQEVSNLQSELTRLTGLKNNEKQVRAQASRMTTALPKAPSVSSFIIQVQDAANSAGIDFLSITPSMPAVPTEIAPTTKPAAPTTAPKPVQSNTAKQAPSAPTTPLRTISVQLNAEGKFFEIEQFILRLEHLGRAVKIDDLALSAGGQDPAAGNTSGSKISAAMKLQIFMLTPQAAAPTQTTQAPGAA